MLVYELPAQRNSELSPISQEKASISWNFLECDGLQIFARDAEKNVDVLSSGRDTNKGSSDKNSI